jgi:hypothetical protein
MLLLCLLLLLLLILRSLYIASVVQYSAVVEKGPLCRILQVLFLVLEQTRSYVSFKGRD